MPRKREWREAQGDGTVPRPGPCGDGDSIPQCMTHHEIQPQATTSLQKPEWTGTLRRAFHSRAIAHDPSGLARVLRWLLGLAFLATASLSPAATIAAFSPDRGGPGTEVTLVGTGLQTTMFVYFGSTEAAGEILSRSATSVRARVPPNALTGQLSVFTSGSGSASSLQIFITTPRVESFTPVFGSPGALVTLNGANFGTGQFGSRGNVTSVLFNGLTARFEIAGLNQLLALVPNEATTGPITVANEAGSTTTFLPFHVAALIRTVTPTNGAPGDAIEIAGSNLGTALRVEFGLERADFSVVSPSLLVARVPTNAINARIQVTTPAGSVATPGPFVVRPRIIQFQPKSGSIGTNVVLEGGGFHGVTSVEFNGTRAAFTAVSSLRVNAVVPAGASTGPLRITTTNGTFTTTELFHLPARIDSFNPNSGKRGDAVIIDGQNLAGTSRVLFNGAAAEFTVTSPTRITATIPALATSGRLTVETPASSVLSSGTFNVTPVLDSFSPGQAPAGSPVVLSGAGMTNLVWVRLGELDTSFTLLDPTRVRVIVPLNAFSGPFRLRNLNGIEATAPGTFFVEGARPTITSFSPTRGAGGTVVQIRGNGLLSASRVQFNGTDGVIRSKTATTVEATVPANASTGPISITTLDGIAVSTTPFTLEEPIVRLSVERGIASDEVILRWPTSATGYVLESTSLLQPAGSTWTSVPGTPTVEGANFRLRIVIPAVGQVFYRLRK